MQPDRIARLARDERLARYAGFPWGLAEGLAFFIVPDVYITFATLFSTRAGIIAWAWSLVGSLVAVLVIWMLVTMFGGGYVAFLQNVPGISIGLLQQTSVKLAADGLPMTPFLVLGGVPLKVYASLAFTLGISLGTALLWTVFARLVRIAPVFLFVAGVRWLFRKHVDDHPGLWFMLFVFAWGAFYTFYFIQMSRI
ncbi:MAG: hypothetical protein ACRENH_15850 [Gemmatimonadaceae bacterium]